MIERPRRGRGRWRRHRTLLRLLAPALTAAALLAPRAAGAGGARAADPASPSALPALAEAAPSLDRHVLALALRATACAARRGLVSDDADVLTVIDYSRPSTEPRLWLFDLAQRTLLRRELVAHGRGSGENRAIRFSNEPGSRATSLGLFVTGGTYEGRHGRSLRLTGLEPGVNDHAGDRAIVVHGADYVSPEFAALHGRLGRSWGCPALPRGVAQRVIDRIRGGTPVFAYYPDRGWLDHSTFLGSCPAPRDGRVAAR